MRTTWRSPALVALVATTVCASASGLVIREGTEFQINTYTSGHQGLIVSAAADADGDFVVVWESVGAANVNIIGLRFASSGTALASEFQVNTHTWQSSQPRRGDGRGR